MKPIDAGTNDAARATRVKEIGVKMQKECDCRAIVEKVERYGTKEVTA